MRLPYDIRHTVMKMSTILVLHCSSFVYTKANDLSLVDSSLCAILNICYLFCLFFKGVSRICDGLYETVNYPVTAFVFECFDYENIATVSRYASS